MTPYSPTLSSAVLAAFMESFNASVPAPVNALSRGYLSRATPINALARGALSALPMPIGQSWADVGGERLFFDVYERHRLPETCGAIYVATSYRDFGGWTVQYVGQTERAVRVRILEHAKEDPSWWQNTSFVHVMGAQNAFYRDFLESSLIQSLQPPGNQMSGPAHSVFQALLGR